MDGATWTKYWEGSRLSVYDDSDGHILTPGEVPRGTPTVGIGHTGHDVVPGDVWTQVRVESAFAQDHQRAMDNALRALGHGVFPLGDPRWGVAGDMAFELGLAGLEEFHDMLSALRVGAWDRAADALLASRYAAEVPRRAEANAQIIRTGAWISPHPNDPTIT